MYESHITIQAMDVKEFQEICKTIQAKSLVIDQDTGSNNLTQMMTAKFHNTQSYQVAYNEMQVIAGNFPNVIRLKLEKIISKGEEPKDYLYLEYHLKYRVESMWRWNFLSTVDSNGAHSSVNTLKDDGTYFVTTRSEEKYKTIKERLKSFKLLSVIRECVVFDNNPEIDSGWMGCKMCTQKDIYGDTVEIEARMNRSMALMKAEEKRMCNILEKRRIERRNAKKTIL